MKTLAYATALTALTVVAAHAQVSYETGTVTTTSTDNGVTRTVESKFVSATTVQPSIPNGVIGDAPATPVETADNHVKVKLPNGTVLDVADSDASPWNKDSRLQGYDRFTFDPAEGVFVAGMGEERFAGNWDENGNRIKKAAAPAPKKAAKKKVAAPAAEPAVETPAEPAAETPAAPADSSTGDVPMPENVPAAQ